MASRDAGRFAAGYKETLFKKKGRDIFSPAFFMPQNPIYSEKLLD